MSESRKYGTPIPLPTPTCKHIFVTRGLFVGTSRLGRPALNSESNESQ